MHAKVFLLDFIRRGLYRWTKRFERGSFMRALAGRSSKVVLARNQSRLRASEALKHKTGQQVSRQPRFFCVASGTGRRACGDRYVDKLLVRGTERFEIAITTRKTRLGRELLRSNLISDRRNLLLRC